MSTKPDVFGPPKIVDGGPRGVSARVLIAPGGATDLHIVSITGGAEANLQFDMTMSDDILVTVYGDKLTTMTITGVAFPKDVMCSGSPPDITSYYKQYKAKRGQTPTQVSVSFNDTVFAGVLTAMTVQPYNIQGIDAFACSLTIYGRLKL